jgi:hypothetical protein
MRHVLPLAVLVVVVAACGSSDDSSDGSTDGGAPRTGDASSNGFGDGGANGDGGSGGAADGGSSAEAGTPPPDTDGGSVTPPAATCTSPLTAADVSKPDAVVGTGTAASCTAAALTTALTAGGIVTFSCGSAPVTITVTSTIELPTGKNTVVDGGGTVTLDGGGKVRILDWTHNDYRVNTFGLTLQNITLAHGKATGTIPYASHPAPCSSGFYDGAGGALYMQDGVLHVVDSTFTNNQAESTGPDIGGGAIYLTGALHSVISGSTFLNNSGANAGAIGSLNSDLDVYNSTFQGNAALGFGANGDNSDTANGGCAYKATNGQNQTGSGGNGGAIAIDGGSDTTHTFCGSTFKGNKGGVGALGGALFRTPDGSQQTTTIDRCLFDSNTGDSAGAAYFHNSVIALTSSTFTANAGAKGSGAIQADGSVYDFTNDTFAGNHATTGVGATLSLFGNSGTLLNCTFADNACDTSAGFGAAIFGPGQNLTIQNTIFDDNTAPNAGSAEQCFVGTITGSGDMQWPVKRTTGGATDTLCAPGIFEGSDPSLGTLGDHGGPVPTMVPSATSAAQKRGTGCPATDARGVARTAGSCTAGAVEGSN